MAINCINCTEHTLYVSLSLNTFFGFMCSVYVFLRLLHCEWVLLRSGITPGRWFSLRLRIHSLSLLTKCTPNKMHKSSCNNKRLFKHLNGYHYWSSIENCCFSTLIVGIFLLKFFLLHPPGQRRQNDSKNEISSHLYNLSEKHICCLYHGYANGIHWKKH